MGSKADLKAAVKELAASFSGSLLLPGDSGYDEARRVHNGYVDKKPALVARCRGAADVAAAVKLGRAHSLELAIRGGGHNVAGRATVDDGLMIDLSLMRGVHVDPVARLAQAEAGADWRGYNRETQLHGLAAVLGFVSNTGIAGLTLGGGFGYLTRRFGWTSDNVASMDVVTADGRLVRASEKENADLFWGLRGGGGNFGVVTGFEYKLFPVGPEVVAGGIAWRAEQAREVLELYHTLSEQGPPELTCVLALRIAPPAPWLQEDVHGKPIIALFVCHSGPVERAENEVARIKSFGSPVGDTVQRRPYVSQQSLLDATQPKGRRYYWKSEYLAGLGPALFEKLIEHAGRIGSPHSAVVLFPIGGALGALAADHSAVGNRDAAYIVNVTASWESAADDASNVEWARGAWRDMRPFSTGGTYVNFLTEEEGGERIQAAYGKNYARLVELKAKWDPDNLFRANKNIAPRA